jgi:hypothetical protein
LQEELARLRAAAAAEIAGAPDGDALDTLRVRYLGRKGELNLLLRGLGGLAATLPAMGGRRQRREGRSPPRSARGRRCSPARPWAGPPASA